MEDTMEVPENSEGNNQERRRLFAENLGRLFEIGFNTGLLAGVRQHQEITTYFGTLYEEELRHLRLAALLDEMYQRTGLISEWDKEALQNWITYFFQKGFLSGLSLFDEYLNAFANHKPKLKRQIVYLQCNFYGDTSLGTYTKNEQAAVEDLMKQFQAQGSFAPLTEDERRQHLGKGNFLRADTLLLLKYGRQWRILCIDLSVFSVGALDEAPDLKSIQNIRQILASELRYLRSKSVFTNLSIDGGSDLVEGEEIPEQLKNYFTAFKRADKETVKLIQAASYAYDFYLFLLRRHVLTENDEVLFNIVGYTDRASNTMSINQEQIALLRTCAEIYKTHTTDKTIEQAREYVLRSVQKATGKAFSQGRDFIKSLVNLVSDYDGIRWLVHDETLENFTNTRTPMRREQLGQEIITHLAAHDYESKPILDVHAALVKQELATNKPYLFLTGNPGIGKTTAIVDFLKAAEQRGEGFLFLYVSPRKHVNLDIIEKFRTTTVLPPCQALFGLTANSAIIRNNRARKTVHYYSQLRNDTFTEHGVTFIHADSSEAQQQKLRARNLEEIQEGLLIDKGERISGVLNSLSSALYATLEKPLAHAIVATVAIQSLKRVGGGKGNTLRHLNTIFQGVFNNQNEVIPHKMELLRKNIKHVFVMIDEVTGDESGVEFLHEIHSFLAQRELLNSSLLHTKIIVADASIVDPQIITRHLADTTYEPDKIYFRRLRSDISQEAAPLTIQDLQFRSEAAAVINANSYPASKLHLRYIVGVDALLYDTKTYKERSKLLETELEQRLLQHITELFKRKDVAQFLVYIQDKQRLTRLVEAMRKRLGAFEKGKDYLEIHANISEADREDITRYRTNTRVVFMTASASRGLSFPETTHILVDIPHFEVEQNLMEILQVIYRGRGGERDQEEKYLSFYLTDRVVYTGTDNRNLSVRENMLHLLNVLLVLKTSIMTRIAGGLTIGVDQSFMMIPIGGKSISLVGETFTSKMSNLIKEAQNLFYQKFTDRRLKHVYESLTLLLEHVHISLRPAMASEEERFHYIPLLPTFSRDFSRRMRLGFDQLLHYPLLQKSHIAGSLLVAPIGTMLMQEAYWVQLEQLLRADAREETDLLADMESLRYDRAYPESFQHALQDGILLLRLLKEMAEGKIPRYEQETNATDQYYALPLMSFLTYETMKEYFGTGKEELEAVDEYTFRILLERYVRSLYPADSILPIGRYYDEFPFLVFRSLMLNEARSKIFSGKYLFMSQELNIITMLLSSSE